MLSRPKVNGEDQVAIEEMRETRALAIAGAVDAVASRAIGLRVDLHRCMADNRALQAMIAELEAEIAALKSRKRRKGNAV